MLAWNQLRLDPGNGWVVKTYASKTARWKCVPSILNVATMTATGAGNGPPKNSSSPMSCATQASVVATQDGCAFIASNLRTKAINVSNS